MPRISSSKSAEATIGVPLDSLQLERGEHRGEGDDAVDLTGVGQLGDALRPLLRAALEASTSTA